MLGGDPTAQPYLPLSLRLASFRGCVGPSCDHGKVRVWPGWWSCCPCGDLSGDPPGSASTPLCGACPAARAPDQRVTPVLAAVHGVLTTDKTAFPAQARRSLG